MTPVEDHSGRRTPPLTNSVSCCRRPATVDGFSTVPRKSTTSFVDLPCRSRPPALIDGDTSEVAHRSTTLSTCTPTVSCTSHAPDHDRTRLRSGAAGDGGSAARGTRAGGAGATSLGGAGAPAGAGGTGGASAASPGGARTRGTKAAGAGGVGGAGARGAGVGHPGAGGVGAGESGTVGAGAGDSGAGIGGAGAGGAGAADPDAGVTGAGGAGAGGAGAGGAGAGVAGAGRTSAGGTVQRRPFFVPPPLSSLPPPDSVLCQVLSLPSSTSLPPSLLSPQPCQTQPRLQPDSPLHAPSPCTEQTDSFTERREPDTRLASPVCIVCTGRRVPRPRPPPVPGTHVMALRPSSVPLRVPLPPPPESSLLAVPDTEYDLARPASPTIPRLLASVVTDPLFESTAASALVAELIDFVAVCRLEYACLAVQSESACPPSIGGECALGTDVLEERGDYGSYSSQWQTAMDAEMASWKSTGTYVNAFPPSWANIVDGMWIFRVFQRFGFWYSSPQSTPLPTGHSLSTPPSDESVEPSGPSSCEAEIYAGAMAAQELRWLTYLLTDLGERPRSSPVLYVDNKAMIALRQEHKLEHRTKHIALRYFLARELQQRGQLRPVYVASRANTADIFTKALQSGDHQCFYTVLGLVPTLPHLLTA
ncbi:unnamed protein product [Closterium sp. NIES-53]